MTKRLCSEVLIIPVAFEKPGDENRGGTADFRARPRLGGGLFVAQNSTTDEKATDRESNEFTLCGSGWSHMERQRR
jgi:hypothetical protein